MSQNWHVLATDDTLANSRGYIVANFQDLFSHFSGSSAPSTPVPEAGMIYYDSTNKRFNAHNGSGWVYLTGDVSTGHYCGLLPRVGGSGYPMSGDLYLGSNKIQNLGSATLTTDGANLGDVRSEIDDHFHEGGSGDGPKINCIDGLTSEDQSDWQIIQTGTSDSMRGRDVNMDSTTGATSINGSDWTDIASVDVYAYAAEPKFIVFSFLAITAWVASYFSHPLYRVTRDGTEILGPITTQVNGASGTSIQSYISNAFKTTAHSTEPGDTYTWTLQAMYPNAVTQNVYEAYLWVF